MYCTPRENSQSDVVPSTPSCANSHDTLSIPHPPNPIRKVRTSGVSPSLFFLLSLPLFFYALMSCKKRKSHTRPSTNPQDQTKNASHAILLPPSPISQRWGGSQIPPPRVKKKNLAPRRAFFCERKKRQDCQWLEDQKEKEKPRVRRKEKATKGKFDCKLFSFVGCLHHHCNMSDILSSP